MTTAQEMHQPGGDSERNSGERYGKTKKTVSETKG